MSHKRKLAISRARALRKTETNAEDLMWRELRGRHPEGLKFRRQHPIPPYILDLAERSLKLAIEIDGSTHSEPHEIAHDENRTRFLTEKGWHVIRFSNTEVYEEFEWVIEAIWKTAMDLKHEKH